MKILLLDATLGTLKEGIKYILFFCAVLLLRLPFLADGYGLDGDSWAVALSSLHWNVTGVYEASRFPGYPVHEFLCSQFVSDSFWVLNLLTATFSSIGILFFVMGLRELRFRLPFLAGFALACIPVVFIHSTTVIDYSIALAFELMAFYFMARRWYWMVGVALGMAIGTRITSGALLIPFVILVLDKDDLQDNLWRILKVALPAIVIGMIWYYPVYHRYGFDFLTYYDVPYPSIMRVFYKFFVEVWGVLGLVAVMLGVLFMFIPEIWWNQTYLFPRAVSVREVVAWLVAIDLYVIAFLKLPMESGYLLPIIPFVILVLGKYLVRPAFIIVCGLFITSSFLFSVSPMDRPDAETPSNISFGLKAGGERLILDVLKGPIISYKSRRENGMNYAHKIIAHTTDIKLPSVLICGQWYNQLISINKDTVRGKVLFVSHVNEMELIHYFARGKQLYYLPMQAELNQQVKGADPVVFGAKVFDPYQ